MTDEETLKICIGDSVYFVPPSDKILDEPLTDRWELIEIHPFDSHDNTDIKTLLMRVKRYDTPSHVTFRRRSYPEMRWYPTSCFTKDRNEAIRLCENVIHDLVDSATHDYDEPYIVSFRQYGSAREALCAEHIRASIDAQKAIENAKRRKRIRHKKTHLEKFVTPCRA